MAASACLCMGSASVERVGHGDCADHCMLINGWVWLRSQVLLFNAGNGLGFSFGGRVWTEMEIWRTKGMFMLACKWHIGCYQCSICTECLHVQYKSQLHTSLLYTCAGYISAA